MKLVVAVVQARDAGGVVDALLAKEFRCTRIDASGGFLRRTNAMILVGVDEDRVDDVAAIIRDNSHARTERVTLPSIPLAGAVYPSLDVPVGGAVLFVLPVERFVRA